MNTEYYWAHENVLFRLGLLHYINQYSKLLCASVR